MPGLAAYYDAAADGFEYLQIYVVIAIIVLVISVVSFFYALGTASFVKSVVPLAAWLVALGAALAASSYYLWKAFINIYRGLGGALYKAAAYFALASAALGVVQTSLLAARIVAQPTSPVSGRWAPLGGVIGALTSAFWAAVYYKLAGDSGVRSFLVVSVAYAVNAVSAPFSSGLAALASFVGLVTLLRASSAAEQSMRDLYIKYVNEEFRRQRSNT
ncbi:hypothetical protein TUZN_1117 [Thermoproteus uzoniensis 768-20]|uniref:Uncharacterized protein n=1 Tax=Thermoproteus uzoniensis (strain 768-20) TaxID=999630 RepID=F2L0B5_THEU7|nr:hypothetical protein [Thermoproteus uzoniensis]AEA12597.1 hypothetical protein TUZN_1117 [Thermoproteus uzoniensis 768-20]